jgi:hypothetical protein
MWNAIVKWIDSLDDYPGWKDWQRERLQRTLFYEVLVWKKNPIPAREFRFSDEIEKQHAVVFGYIGLLDTLSALQECEYYFRRFPFRDLPVGRSSHITNICEMYFGRFYEFRERLKKFLNAVKEVTPDEVVPVGNYLKAYDKMFGEELRERHGVHHHRRFADTTIDWVYLTGVVSVTRESRSGYERGHLTAYRKVTREWARRVRRRSESVERFLEIVTKITLSECQFLSDLAATEP